MGGRTGGLARHLVALAPDGVDIALGTAASGSLTDLIAIVGDPARASTIADYANAHRLGVHLALAQSDSTLLAEAGALGREGHTTPRIERTYPFEQLAEAQAQSELGHTRGNAIRI